MQVYESRLGYQKHLTGNEFILWVFVVIKGAPLSKLLKVDILLLEEGVLAAVVLGKSSIHAEHTKTQRWE